MNTGMYCISDKRNSQYLTVAHDCHYTEIDKSKINAVHKQWVEIFREGLQLHVQEARVDSSDGSHTLEAVENLTEEDIVLAIGSLWSAFNGADQKFAFAGMDFFAPAPKSADPGFQISPIGVVGNSKPFLMPLLLHPQNRDHVTPQDQTNVIGHIVFVYALPPGTGHAAPTFTVYDSLPGVVSYSHIWERLKRLLGNSHWLSELPQAIDSQQIAFDDCPAQQPGQNTCGTHTILAAWSVLLGLPMRAEMPFQKLGGIKKDAYWEDFYTSCKSIINHALAGHMDTLTLRAFFYMWGLAPLEPLSETPKPSRHTKRMTLSSFVTELTNQKLLDVQTTSSSLVGSNSGAEPRFGLESAKNSAGENVTPDDMVDPILKESNRSAEIGANVDPMEWSTKHSKLATSGNPESQDNRGRNEHDYDPFKDADSSDDSDEDGKPSGQDAKGRLAAERRGKRESPDKEVQELKDNMTTSTGKYDEEEYQGETGETENIHGRIDIKDDTEGGSRSLRADRNGDLHAYCDILLKYSLSLVSKRTRATKADRPHRIKDVAGLKVQDVVFAIASIWAALSGEDRPYAFAGPYFFDSPASAGPDNSIGVVGGDSVFVMPVLIHPSTESLGILFSEENRRAVFGHIILALAFDQRDQTPSRILVEVYDSSEAAGFGEEIKLEVYRILHKGRWPRRRPRTSHWDTLFPQNSAPSSNITIVNIPTPQQAPESNTCGIHTVLAAWAKMLEIPIASHRQLSFRRDGRDLYDGGLELVNHVLAGNTDTLIIQAYLNCWGFYNAPHPLPPLSIVRFPKDRRPPSHSLLSESDDVSLSWIPYKLCKPMNMDRLVRRLTEQQSSEAEHLETVKTVRKSANVVAQVRRISNLIKGLQSIEQSSLGVAEKQAGLKRDLEGLLRDAVHLMTSGGHTSGAQSQGDALSGQEKEAIESLSQVVQDGAKSKALQEFIARFGQNRPTRSKSDESKRKKDQILMDLRTQNELRARSEPRDLDALKNEKSFGEGQPPPFAIPPLKAPNASHPPAPPRISKSAEKQDVCGDSLDTQASQHGLDSDSHSSSLDSLFESSDSRNSSRKRKSPERESHEDAADRKARRQLT